MISHQEITRKKKSVLETPKVPATFFKFKKESAIPCHEQGKGNKMRNNNNV